MPAEKDPDIGAPWPTDDAFSSARLGLSVTELKLTVVVEMGRVRMSLRELMQLKPGDVVELNTAPLQPVDLRVQGRLVARGEIVVVGDRHGICLTDILCA